MELGLRLVESQGAHEARGATQGVPCTLVDRVWAPWDSTDLNPNSIYSLPGRKKSERRNHHVL